MFKSTLESPVDHYFRQSNDHNASNTAIYEESKMILRNSEELSPDCVSSDDTSGNLSKTSKNSKDWDDTCRNHDQNIFSSFNDCKNDRPRELTNRRLSGVRCGPLIASIDARGEYVQQASVDSAESEEAMISAPANNLAPKAHVPDIGLSQDMIQKKCRNLGRTEKDGPLEMVPNPLSPINLLNPMEPMKMKQNNTHYPHLSQNSPFAQKSLPPIIRFSSVDTGVNPSIYNSEQKIPSLIEDRRLAKAVASDSGMLLTNPFQSSQFSFDNRTTADHFNPGGCPAELKKQFADAHNLESRTQTFPNSETYRSSSKFSKPPGSSDSFPAQNQTYLPAIALPQKLPESRFSHEYSTKSLTAHECIEQIALYKNHLPNASSPPQLDSLINNNSNTSYEEHKMPLHSAIREQLNNGNNDSVSDQSSEIDQHIIAVEPPVPTSNNVGYDQQLHKYSSSEPKTSQVYNKWEQEAAPHKENNTKVKSNVKIYKCSYPGCKWSFVRSSDHKRHLRSHEKPSLRCPFWEVESSCSKRAGMFYRLDVLKRHLRLVHLIRPTDGSNEGGRCRICLEVFKSTRAFIDHCESCAHKLNLRKLGSE